MQGRNTLVYDGYGKRKGLRYIVCDPGAENGSPQAIRIDRDFRVALGAGGDGRVVPMLPGAVDRNVARIVVSRWGLTKVALWATSLCVIGIGLGRLSV